MDEYMHEMVRKAKVGGGMGKGVMSPTSCCFMPVKPSKSMKKTSDRRAILPLRVHTHCTAAVPISPGDCRGDMGIACIVSAVMVVMMLVAKPTDDRDYRCGG